MLHAHSATQLASMIRRGETTCRAVVEAHLARVEALNPTLNAVTALLAEEARAAAERADAGPPMGPLHGVPITIKENLDRLGTATTHGVRAARRVLPYATAPAIARLEAAGAIVLGRTNLSEMGLRVACDNPLRGRTRNPHDLARTVGGSSGGDAAAVAAGMVPLGVGTDMGGSLRIPAALCGVAALKPTTGRIPHASSLPPYDHGLAGQLMLTLGPIARAVEDLRLALSVMAGRDHRDPRSVSAPLEGPRFERRAALAVDLSMPKAERGAILRAGAALEAAGWDVEEATPPGVDEACALWATLAERDFRGSLPAMRPLISPTLEGYLERLLEHLAGERLRDAHRARSRLSRAWSGFFEELPVLIGPAVIGGAWPLDDDLAEGGLERLGAATRFILPANALGVPSVALPMGDFNERPLGVQIYADFWREDVALEAAEIVEGALP